MGKLVRLDDYRSIGERIRIMRRLCGGESFLEQLPEIIKDLPEEEKLKRDGQEFEQIHETDSPADKLAKLALNTARKMREEEDDKT